MVGVEACTTIIASLSLKCPDFGGCGMLAGSGNPAWRCGVVEVVHCGSVGDVG